MSTPAVEEYLELLYRLSSPDPSAPDRGVRPAEIARGLGISTAAVAEMLSRLESQGLITRGAGREVILTAEGQQVGRSQIRKHRLVERLLYSLIGRPWDAVHDEACRFEHVMTDDLTDSLEKALGSPSTCPHGNPIPALSSAEGAEGAEEEVPLAGCRVGQEVVVARVADEESELLKYLLSLGLLPGTSLRVEQVAPLGGPLLIQVGQAHYAIGRDVAASIWVREAQPAEAASPAVAQLKPATSPAAS